MQNGSIMNIMNIKDVSINDNEAEFYFSLFLTAMGISWANDPQMVDTPARVVKSWKQGIMKGLYSEIPSITSFPNEGYTGIVLQSNIEVFSICAHHLLPFTGKSHVAYIPTEKGKVIGLSKLNRIVDYYSRRPQIQEKLTKEVHDFLKNVVDSLGIIVYFECKHSCCSNRGIGHDSVMKTVFCSGAFLVNEGGCKDEFYELLK